MSDKVAEAGAAANLLSGAAKSAHADYVPVLRWFCTSIACPVVADRVIIYFDQYHITRQYSLFIEPLLAAALKPLGVN